MSEVPPDGVPGRKVPWQHAPLATGTEHVEDRIDYGAQIGSARLPTLPRRKEMPADQGPLDVGQVRRAPALRYVMAPVRGIEHGLGKQPGDFSHSLSGRGFRKSSGCALRTYTA